MSQWTVDTLKDLMDERDKRYTERHEAQKLAIQVAEENAEKWRANANEWRTAMSDKDRNFVTKSAMWGYFVGAIGLAVLLISLFLKTFGN